MHTEWPMHTEWIDRTVRYDGSQLRSHWIRRTIDHVGDAWVAFRGPCAVSMEEMADLEDLLSGPGIAGDDMVHFVGEFFDGGDLPRAVLRQRLFAATALEVVRDLATAPTAGLRRDGDDLYLADAKLSISVATKSLVSSLLHFAANVTTAGTPVRTVGLSDLGIAPKAFAGEVLTRVLAEETSMHRARCQVLPKGSAD